MMTAHQQIIYSSQLVVFWWPFIHCPALFINMEVNAAKRPPVHSGTSNVAISSALVFLARQATTSYPCEEAVCNDLFALGCSWAIWQPCQIYTYLIVPYYSFISYFPWQSLFTRHPQYAIPKAAFQQIRVFKGSHEVSNNAGVYLFTIENITSTHC